jgi:acyl carrier protein
MENVEQKIKEIVAEQLALRPEQVTLESKFEDLNCDSLDAVEIAMACEEAFVVMIDDDEAANLKTVGDLVKLVEARV